MKEEVLEYDGSGRPLHVLRPDDGYEELREYDDILGRPTRIERRVTTEGDHVPVSVETRGYVDAPGARRVDIVSEADTGTGSGLRRTRTTRLSLDAQDRVSRVDDFVEGEVAVRRMQYDARGNVTRVDEPMGEYRRSSYDHAGRLVESTRGGSEGASTTTLTRDAGGLVIAQRGPHPDERWEMEHDAFGELLSMKLVGEDGSAKAEWKFEYGQNATVRITDPEEVRVDRYLDARGEVLAEVVLNADGSPPCCLKKQPTPMKLSLAPFQGDTKLEDRRRRSGLRLRLPRCYGFSRARFVALAGAAHTSGAQIRECGRQRQKGLGYAADR